MEPIAVPETASPGDLVIVTLPDGPYEHAREVAEFVRGRCEPLGIASMILCGDVKVDVARGPHA